MDCIASIYIYIRYSASYNSTSARSFYFSFYVILKRKIKSLNKQETATLYCFTVCFAGISDFFLPILRSRFFFHATSVWRSWSRHVILETVKRSISSSLILYILGSICFRHQITDLSDPSDLKNEILFVSYLWSTWITQISDLTNPAREQDFSDSSEFLEH